MKRFVSALIFALTAGIVHGADKAIPVSCDQLWPLALHQFVDSGFGLQATDKSGGIMTLEWTKGASVARFNWGSRSIDRLIKSYSTNYSGAFSTWLSFEPEQITASLLDVGDAGCRINLSARFKAYNKGGFASRAGWFILNSNGTFEADLLEKVASRVKGLPLVPSERKPQPPPEGALNARTIEAPRIGTIQVDSIPPGADIEVNGKFSGSTPSILTLPPGELRIVVRKAGHREWVRALGLTGGDSLTLRAELEADTPNVIVVKPGK